MPVLLPVLAEVPDISQFPHFREDRIFIREDLLCDPSQTPIGKAFVIFLRTTGSDTCNGKMLKGVTHKDTF
jgi:hypothetical protein